MGAIHVGTAGWSISSVYKADFPATGTHLERYAARFDCVEINSSFYRPHLHETYTRWADSVPDGFRFSVKMPKSITHEKRLRNYDSLLAAFLGEVSGLGDKLAVLLAQTPPSLAFEASTVEVFLRAVLSASTGRIVVEARHRSWFKPEAESLLADLGVAQVAADPPHGGSVAPATAGRTGIAYFRFHGWPRIYYSNYNAAALEGIASDLKMAAHGGPVWCIFDNTAEGHALANARDMLALLGSARDGDGPPGSINR